jgi:nucleoid DNA-binding protein
MDIDLLSKMVKELILDDDRVVLPGLGCFVAEIVPPYFSDKGYTINPPYRKLYFRSRPDEGDALIEFYMKSNDVSYEVAERIVKDFVSELKSVLHAKKMVLFPGLGRLRATKENNVFFIADEDLDIYPEGFGLGPISLKTHQETSEEVTAAVADLKTLLEADPVPDSDPVSDSSPLLDSDPKPEADPEPDPDSKPEPEPEQEVKVESVNDPKPEPEIEILVEPVDEVVVSVPVVEKPSGKNWVKVLLVILAVLALLVVAYMLVGRLCPEWIDRFLYTPEELKILNS